MVSGREELLSAEDLETIVSSVPGIVTFRLLNTYEDEEGLLWIGDSHLEDSVAQKLLLKEAVEANLGTTWDQLEATWWVQCGLEADSRWVRSEFGSLEVGWRWVRGGSGASLVASRWARGGFEVGSIELAGSEVGSNRVRGGLLGPAWDHLGPTVGQLGDSLGQFGANLGPTWANLRPSWGQLGPSWGQLAGLVAPRWARTGLEAASIELAGCEPSSSRVWPGPRWLRWRKPYGLQWFLRVRGGSGTRKNWRDPERAGSVFYLPVFESY